LQAKRKRQLHNLPQAIKETTIDHSFTQELDDVIRKNIADHEFNVAQLACKLFISEATLYRKLMALTGQSPSHYLRSHRLKMAAELIKKDRSSITDIAFAVGFSSHAYFTRCFKEQFLQLPSNYE
jgi:transcriptional regulator GlxA family with amidase domain